MSKQQESDIRNHLSNRPGIVGSKHNSATQCANPQCSKELVYLREGTLNLFEMESHSDDQFQSDVGAFAMRSVPSKFFWLCGECTKTLIIKRWTTSGLVLVPRNRKTAGSHPNLAARPATAATTRLLPVPLAVPPVPPMGASASSARFACAAEKFTWPNGGLPPKNFYDRCAGIQALSSLRPRGNLLCHRSTPQLFTRLDLVNTTILEYRDREQ